MARIPPKSVSRDDREVLNELPLGVCSLTPDGEILIWNNAMARISGIPGSEAIGHRLSELEAPWQGVLGDFVGGGRERALHLRQDCRDDEQRGAV